MDEILREMLIHEEWTDFDQHSGDELTDFIAQIKQVFADEGKCYMHDHQFLLKNIKKTGLMTGAEFYERFEKELKLNQGNDVMAAARRASGL